MTIKKLRQTLMITQTELGKLLGVCKRTVIRWEMGHNQPGEDSKIRIAELQKKHIAKSDR